MLGYLTFYFVSVLGIVRWVCSVLSQMNKYTFFLWLRFLFICIANMRPGAVQVGVWNTVDQWSFLEFVVGQTHLFPLAAFSVYLYHWRVQVLSKSEWNTVDQRSFLKFVVGQTQIYIASGKDLAPKQRLLLIESQDLHPVKYQSGLQSRFHFVTLFFFWT